MTISCMMIMLTDYYEEKLGKVKSLTKKRIQNVDSNNIPSNGGLPTRNSYMSTPKLHTSAAESNIKEKFECF